MKLTQMLLLAGVAVLALGFTVDARAASVDIGFGGVDCNEVKRAIRRDWMELKDFFRPGQKDLKRPGSRDYYCVSPYYIREAMPARQRTIGLSCYNVQGARFCCDQRKRSCAGVR